MIAVRGLLFVKYPDTGVEVINLATDERLHSFSQLGDPN
jgi:hypothetical protein